MGTDETQIRKPCCRAGINLCFICVNLWLKFIRRKWRLISRTSHRDALWRRQKIAQPPCRQISSKRLGNFSAPPRTHPRIAKHFYDWPARCRATSPASRTRCAWCRGNPWRKARLVASVAWNPRPNPPTSPRQLVREINLHFFRINFSHRLTQMKHRFISARQQDFLICVSSVPICG